MTKYFSRNIQQYFLLMGLLSFFSICILLKKTRIPNKTLVLVSTHQLEFCDFAFLAKLDSPPRVVLLATEEHAKALPEHIRKHIDHIYICAYANPQALLSGLSYPDASQAIEEELAYYQTPHEIYINTFYEFDVQLVGELRKAFGFLGLPSEYYSPFRDKCLMKKIVATAGLRVPRFASFDLKKAATQPGHYFETLRERYQLPFICKPINAAASIGVYKIHSYTDFLAMCEEIKDTYFTYEVEEFIHGTLYHCDLILQNGEAVFEACGEALFPWLESSQGKIASSLILPQDDPVGNKIRTFTKQCIKALGLPQGAVHAEVFRSECGELVFLEAGARPPGLDICSAYRTLFDISLQTLSLEIALGLPLQCGKPAATHLCWGHIPITPGRVQQLNTPAVSSTMNLSFRVKPDETLSKGISYLGCAGKFTLTNQNFEVLKKDIELIRAFEFVTMRKN